MVSLEVRRRVKLTGAELEEYRLKVSSSSTGLGPDCDAPTSSQQQSWRSTGSRLVLAAQALGPYCDVPTSSQKQSWRNTGSRLVLAAQALDLTVMYLQAQRSRAGGVRAQG